MMTDILTELQQVSRAAPFIKSDLGSRELTTASYGWANAGLTVRAVRGSKMRTEDQLFTEVSAALQFPSYFGEIWPAFDECLADLEWLPKGSGFVFVVYDADQVLADAPPQAFATFEKVVHRACDEFSEPVEDGESWDRPATPFHFVLQRSSALARRSDPAACASPQRDAQNMDRQGGEPMADDDIVAALLVAGRYDWVMLTDVLWEATHDERTPEAKDTVRRVLQRVFEDNLMVPGDLGATGFEVWSGTATDWRREALAQIDHFEWKPMGDGFWLNLTDHGEQVAERMSLMECPNDDQGVVLPLVTESGVVVMMCDEGGEVWLQPGDIATKDPIVPADPEWTVRGDIHITPGTTRWANLDDLGDGK